MIQIEWISQLDNTTIHLYCDCGHHAKLDIQQFIAKNGDVKIKDLKRRARCSKCGSQKMSISLSYGMGCSSGWNFDGSTEA